jgi:ATP-dependent helicase/nuclease subunit B
MQSFLSNVIDDILSKEKNISDFTFILPSKRAGVFLKDEIKKKSQHAIIFPKIISIEDFIGELSLINLVDNTSLLFHFYQIYSKHTPKEIRDDFDVFIKWATIALQDFNEIDRHLIDANYIFNYLKDIDQLEKWSLEKGEETAIIKNYFSFFERLETYYFELKKHLLGKQYGYQGLQYREAVENLQSYIENTSSNLILVGFNALNKAEEVIFQELLENDIATIYWDADAYYFYNNQAASFLKKYKNNWKYYQQNEFNWVQENFEKEKKIHIIGAPKNNTQLKYVGELLSKSNTNNFQNTALVLADESLLPLTLNSLPKEVGAINITMGYDLEYMPIAQLFSHILKLHVNSKKDKLNSTFYYKDVLRVLNHTSIKTVSNTAILVDEMIKNNYIFIDEALLQKLTDKEDKVRSILFLFTNWEENPNYAITHCLSLIDSLESYIVSTLEKEFLFKLKAVFQQIEVLNESYGYIKSIKTLQDFYNQLLSNEKLSFKGQPLSGLQLMGMLETRVLDFETIILTSVNEGVLPAGKSDNSFIPFGIKKEVGLPTYQEKDAIFSYHFYRLLQRAKNIYLLYNTESDQYGSGEQSRFISQLEINSVADITKYVVSPKNTVTTTNPKQIVKSTAVLHTLLALAQKGLSPTALTNYIYNPIAFYHQKILKIKETNEVEETIAANTLGTIIHKTLEAFYLPFKGKFLQVEDVSGMKNEVALEVKKWFQQEYKNGDISTGKNLLIYSVAKQFVLNFLNQELSTLKEGKQLKILHLEYDLEAVLKVEGLDFPIKFIGQADRIDVLDGVIRIIDYKTGKVEQKDVTVKDWELITTDYKKYSKSFQVLLYAFMYANMNSLNFDEQHIESGIISFKNLKSGFMKVNKRAIQEEDMNSFVHELKQLVLEIFNLEIPFMEKENLPF